jgi:Acetyltransferase (isoleucine patch superfamily)
VIITTQGHFFQKTDRFMKDQPTLVAKIVIEDDVWIGANATILPGVKVGRGSVIGAGSVVNKDIPEYSLAVGVPAKVIRNRKEAALETTIESARLDPSACISIK